MRLLRMHAAGERVAGYSSGFLTFYPTELTWPSFYRVSRSLESNAVNLY